MEIKFRGLTTGYKENKIVEGYYAGDWYGKDECVILARIPGATGAYNIVRATLMQYVGTDDDGQEVYKFV